MVRRKAQPEVFHKKQTSQRKGKHIDWLAQPGYFISWKNWAEWVGGIDLIGKYKVLIEADIASDIGGLKARSEISGFTHPQVVCIQSGDTGGPQVNRTFQIRRNQNTYPTIVVIQKGIVVGRESGELSIKARPLVSIVDTYSTAELGPCKSRIQIERGSIILAILWILGVT